jgi:dienelactone hydrolase
VARLRTAGHDVQLTEYPNAPHSFDNPLGSNPPALAKNSQSVRHCVIREEPVGQLINAQTHAAFTYEDPCVERGPHIGHDPEATQAARKAVAEFLRTTLRLE